MSTIISGSTPGGVSLIAANNPVTITTTGYLGSPALNANALVGPTGATWIVTNAGLIASADDAIALGAGFVINQSSGTISGVTAGISIYGASAGNVTNAGAIAGTRLYGVSFADGGTVTNRSSGTISGGSGGIGVVGGAGSVVNAGSISGGGVLGGPVGAGAGVALGDGGGVTNQTFGSISGVRYGISVAAAAGTVTNAGLIAAAASGTAAAGVALADGGGVTNQSTGTISGGAAGIFIKAATGTVTNDGTISGGLLFFTSSSNFVIGSGVYLAKGGGVTNQNSGAISGGHGIYVNGGTGTVTNAGTLSGTAGDGVFFAAGGGVTNQHPGTISGTSYGIYIKGGFATVTNAGGVYGTGLGASGIRIGTGTGDGVANLSTGTISGQFGILMKGSSATVVNAGAIQGTSSGGVLLSAGGAVTNQGGATISSGQFDGISIAGSAGIVTNDGLILGGPVSGNGVYLAKGGTVTNQNAGTISAAQGGLGSGLMIAGGAGNVTNAGTISGAATAVALASGFTNRVIVDPGAVFSGTVTGGNAIGAASISTLELASGTAPGLLSGLGSQFIDFAQVAIDAGASWTLTGANTLASGASLTNSGVLTLLGGSLSGAGTVTNNGLIQDDGAAMTMAALYGTGQVLIGPGGMLTVTGSVAATETIVVANGGVLNIDGTVRNAGAIFGGPSGLGVSGSTGETLNANVANLTTGVISGVTYGIMLGSGGSFIAQASSFGLGLLGSIAYFYPLVGSSYVIGAVTNSGAISGGSKGIVVWPAATGTGVTIHNTGTISGGTDGIVIGGTVTGSGTVINPFPPPALSPWSRSQVLGGPATVTNAGTIAGGTYAVQLDSGFTNRVIVDPGAVFSGTVTGGNAIGAASISTLELASGTAPGLLSGLGSQFIDFAQVAIDAGASWTLTGANTLASGASLTNSGVLTLLGGSLSGAGTVTNNGLIQDDGAAMTMAALYGTGQVLIGPGGMLTVTGSVAATETIVVANGGVLNIDGTVRNAGAIFGGPSGLGVSGSTGETLNANVANLTTGVISGVTYGIMLGSGGSFIAKGTFSLSTASVYYSFPLVGSSYVIGAVTNSGAISGGSKGIVVWPAATGTGVTIHNTGTISGGTDGIVIGGTVTGSGTVINPLPPPALSPWSRSQVLGGPATVTNAGTIAGGTYAVQLDSGFTNRVIVDPGAVFSGTVTGGNAIGAASISTLELAAGTAPGLLAGLGSQFIDFAQVAIDAGASWTLTGANTLAAGTSLTNAGVLTLLGGSLSGAGTMTNNGLIQDDGAAMTMAALYGTGQILIGDASTLTVGVATSGTVAFAGDGLLALAAPTAFADQVDGLGAGGRIELTGVTDATSAGIVNANTLAIQQSAGPVIDLTLDPGWNYAGAVFPVGISGGNAIISVTEAADATIIDQGETESVSGAAGSQLAASPGGLGGITVTGGQSLLTTTAGVFAVGDASLGSLTIDAGGTVTTTAGAIIANTTSAAGSSVDVSGTNSNWRVSGLLQVGAAAAGSLQLSDGAVVTLGTLDAAQSAAAVADISVSGAGSDLAVTGLATVADDGTGVLSVLDGASFSAQSLTIGSQGDSSGALVVSGDGSMVSISGELNIGTALGTGDLTVGPGATVDAAVVNLQGGVVLEGGELDPTVYIENGGSTTGGFGTIASDFILLEGTILSNGSKSGKQTEVVQGTVVGGGTADIKGSVSVNGPGILQIGTHDTIELTGAVLNTATTTFTDNLTPTGTYTVNNSVVDVVFQDSTGVLQLDDIGGFAGTVATWHAGDQFVATGETLSNPSVVNGDTLQVQDSGPNASAGGIDTIIFGSAINAGGFSIANGNTIVACFAEGTRIETVDGPRAVEELRVGDRVITLTEARSHHGTEPRQADRVAAEGQAPIVWIGQRRVNCRIHPAPETVWPVVVRAGALGPGQPARDLYLSPDHALFVNNALVPVKLLIDGTGIAQIERPSVTYYHVELPRHAVILAEGTPVESYLDTGDRTNFGSDAMTIRLHPNFAPRLTPDSARIWETRGAARLILTGPALAAARRTVTRAGALSATAAAVTVPARARHRPAAGR